MRAGFFQGIIDQPASEPFFGASSREFSGDMFKGRHRGKSKRRLAASFGAGHGIAERSASAAHRERTAVKYPILAATLSGSAQR
jgi:hypothetical protein